MESSSSHGFGVVLRQHRRATGLTQEEVASAAGVSVRAIREIERGASQPRGATVARLADALGLTGSDRDEFTRAASGTAGAGNGGPPPGAGQAPAGPTPRQLPAATADFTGRSAELKTLTGLLDQGGRSPGTVVITAIGGTAGVGKTALAVHWARQIAGRFPDGQLYVNLRGYDPGQPMPSADALAGFLRALGVPGQDIPPAAEERAARYRSLLAGRRMLVLLDNAASAEQVRPLLPATPDCVAVVTSRDTLPGLVARDGARRLDLDLLSAADAGILLTRLIGDRAAADPAATAALAAACARLPLALRVAAELAASRPGTPLAHLTAELTDEQARLDLLAAGGDPYTAVRAVFSWSCRHLAPDTARAFRLAGLHPRPDFEAYAAAALTGTTLDHAQHLLGALTRANLIHLTAPGHYSQHDLLRDYATELATELDQTDEGEGEGRLALTRLLDHYLHTAATAMDALYPAQRRDRPHGPAPVTPAPPVTEPAAAKAWLDDRREALVEMVAYAAGHGWPRQATQIAVTLAQYVNGVSPGESATVLACARRAARQAGDRAGEAAVLLSLGNFDVHRCRYSRATEYLRQAGAMFREIGDRHGQARTLHELGTIGMMQGRYADSARDHGQAIALFRESEDKAGEARALCNLVAISLFQGQHQEATGNTERALALSQETGDVACEVHLWGHLGLIGQREGRYQEASGHYRQAVALAQQIGHVFLQATNLDRLGDTALGLGRPKEAVRLHRQALSLFQGIDARAGMAGARNGLGEVRLLTGRPDRAYAEHANALGLAREVGDRCEWARALDGLGRACQAIGQPGQARQHWTEALTLYTSIGDPEAPKVAARLAQLDAAG